MSFRQASSFKAFCMLAFRDFLFFIIFSLLSSSYQSV
jgi:hypothetical protein